MSYFACKITIFLFYISTFKSVFLLHCVIITLFIYCLAPVKERPGAAGLCSKEK